MTRKKRKIAAHNHDKERRLSLSFSEQFPKKTPRFFDGKHSKNKEIKQKSEDLSKVRAVLDEQDRALWQLVAASVRPLSSKQQRHTGNRQDNPVTTVISLECTLRNAKLNPGEKCNKDNKVKQYTQCLSEVKPALADAGSEASRVKSALGQASPLRISKNTPVVKDNLPAANLLQQLNRKAQRKVAGKYFDPADRLDLHGLNQDEAYDLLLHFVRSSAARNKSLLLVITGKGRSQGSAGILRQLLPRWLATPPFGSYVSAVETAARPHGGEGAFYVRLRKVIPKQ